MTIKYQICVWFYAWSFVLLALAHMHALPSDGGQQQLLLWNFYLSTFSIAYVWKRAEA